MTTVVNKQARPRRRSVRQSSGITSHSTIFWLRGLAAAVASITRFAAVSGDRRLLDHSQGMFDSAAALVTRFGATPDTEPCCCTMELTTAALALARAGRAQYWDDVDRWFRNHTLECQFRDPCCIEPGSVPGEPKAEDDDRDILNRSVGGFSWATVRTTVDGVDVEPGVEGDYLRLDEVKAGARIVMTYELSQRKTIETTMDTPCQGALHGAGVFGPKTDAVVQERIETSWCGNTVLAIDYDDSLEQSPRHHLYQDRMEKFRRGEGRDDVGRFFLPDKTFDW